jgi:ornithine cyclodeaminase
MVAFVDVASTARWIASVGVEPLMVDMIRYLEHDFTRWERFDKSPRVASHSTFGVIELMPTSDGETYGFKYVNGHPINTKVGKQTVTAFGVLADVESGYPIFLSEMTLLTALRTAATSAMAAKYLARKDAATMAVLGTGAQSEFQSLAFRAALGVNNLRLWDVDPEAMDKLVENLTPLGFDLTICSGVDEAVRDADIITTCTADKRNATVLENDLVVAGVHINAIGGDCPGKTELDSTILERGTVFVEFPEQTRVEGEIQQLDTTFPVVELWTVVAGRHPGRISPAEITVFDSVGFAIEDFSALRFLHDGTASTDFEANIDLIADPSNPKNLFSLIHP